MKSGSIAEGRTYRGMQGLTVVGSAQAREAGICVVGAELDGSDQKVDTWVELAGHVYEENKERGGEGERGRRGRQKEEERERRLTQEEVVVLVDG